MMTLKTSGFIFNQLPIQIQLWMTWEKQGEEKITKI